MSTNVKFQTIKRRGGVMGLALAAVVAGSLLLSGQARADWDDGGYRHERHHDEYREHREYREHYRPRYNEYREDYRPYYYQPRYYQQRDYYPQSGVTVFVPWLR